MSNDVQITFGADIANLKTGVAAAASSITGLKSNVAALGGEFANLGDLTARQVGSVTSLFDRIGSSVGLSLGPLAMVNTELVRAGQHFKEFENAGQAFKAIGATLFEALTNPLTIAIGTLAAVGVGVKFLWDAMSGAPAQSASDVMKDLDETIKAITDHWQQAGDAAKAALNDMTVYGAQAAAIRTLTEGQAQLYIEMSKVNSSTTTFYDQVKNFANYLQSQRLPGGYFQEFASQVAAGKLDVEQFRAILDQIIVDNPTNKTLIAMAANLYKSTDAAEGLIRKLAELKAAAGAIPADGETMEQVHTRISEVNDQLQAALKAQKDADTERIGLVNDEIQASIKAEKDAATTRISIVNDELQASIKAQKNADDERIGLVNDQLQAAIQAQKQAVQEATTVWSGFFNSIVSGFDKSISGLLNGTMTFKQAFGNLLNSLYQSFVQAVEKMVVKWLTGEALKVTATQAGVAARTAAEAAGSSAQAATVFGSILKQILADAQAVFGGIFAFLSPVMGPAAAGPAAGGAATVAAAASAIPALDVGAWNLPRDTLAMVHQGEMIVPANGGFADDFRRMLGGGGNKGGGQSGGPDFLMDLFARLFGPLFRRQTGATQSLHHAINDFMRKAR